jgi:hypothetical protein
MPQVKSKNPPTESGEEERTSLQLFNAWFTQSDNDRRSNERRWAKNMKLVKGLFPEDELEKSQTRKRNKIFFRKIWAEKWRIMAAYHQAFLKDKNSFDIEGVDTLTDPRKAFVLRKVVDYRKRRMMRVNALFTKLLWASQDMFDTGVAYGKLRWVFRKEGALQDEPDFILYPPEQVYPDFIGETQDKMQYVIFQNFLTKNDITNMGLELPGGAQPMTIPSDTVRNVRFAQQRDPKKSVPDNFYPKPEDRQGEDTDTFVDRFEVWEVYYREGNKIKFSITLRDDHMLLGPVDSPYGDENFPLVMGLCLLESHKLIGEGFPEPLEGPQESLNHILNMRKDELALALNPMNIVNRFNNVDLHSLTNVRAGGIALADDAVNAVVPVPVTDITSSAYAEAAADEAMMDEISGITAPIQGVQGASTKATTAQINQLNSNAKVDLYLSIMAETFVKNFFTKLTQYIQRFETDKKIFRIANEDLRNIGALSPLEDDITDIDDFEVDLEINVGLDKVARGLQTQQKFLMMDKMIMANQSLASLMALPTASQIIPPEGIRFFDLTAVVEEVLPDMGMKNVNDFTFRLNQPPPQEQAGGPGGATGIQGALSPQVGGELTPNIQTGAENIPGL